MTGKEDFLFCFFLIISLIALLIFCSFTASTLLKSWRSCCITARAPHCMWFWGTPHQCCSSYRGCPSRGLPRTVFERARAAARARVMSFSRARAWEGTAGSFPAEFSPAVSPSVGFPNEGRNLDLLGENHPGFLFFLLFSLNVWIKLPVDEWQQCGKKNVNLSI